MRGTRTRGTMSCRPPRRRVDSPRGTGFDLQRVSSRATTIGVEARDRRQSAGDRPCRQPRLTVDETHDPPITALVGQEVEDIARHNLDRLLVDDREERLQVEGDRPQRVRPGLSRPRTPSTDLRVDGPGSSGPHRSGTRRGQESGRWSFRAPSQPGMEDTGMHCGSHVY